MIGLKNDHTNVSNLVMNGIIDYIIQSLISLVYSTQLEYQSIELFCTFPMTISIWDNQNVMGNIQFTL